MISLLRRKPDTLSDRFSDSGRCSGVRSFDECVQLIPGMPDPSMAHADDLSLKERVIQARGTRSPNGPTLPRPIGVVVCTWTNRGILRIYAGGNVLAGLAALVRQAEEAGDGSWLHILKTGPLVRLLIADTPEDADRMIEDLYAKTLKRRASDLPSDLTQV
jgi:hypothetical protein